MKVLAIFLSPLVGVFFLFSPFLIMSVINSANFFGKIQSEIQIIGIIYFVALIIQIFIVEIIMLSNDFLYSFKGYCWLALFLSFCFAAIISVWIGIEYLASFFVFLIYSVGNVITYNQLFFKQLVE